MTERILVTGALGCVGAWAVRATLDGGDEPVGYDLAEVAQLWNRGSVVRSWLLELAERALRDDPKMERIRGYVEDSGEGRWTIQEAIEHSVPTPVLAMALFERFRSRQDDSFRDRVIASLRNQFGGHAVKAK